MKPTVLKKNRWRVASDEYNIILQKARRVKGKIIWANWGYFPSPEACLREYAAVLVRESSAPLPEALLEAVDALKQAQTDLTKSLTVKL